MRSWRAPTTQRTVFARANGRRRWNATRRWRATHRRLDVAKDLDTLRRAQLAAPWDPEAPMPSWVP